LKHRSYRTEKTYASWIERFRAGKPADAAESEDIRTIRISTNALRSFTQFAVWELALRRNRLQSEIYNLKSYFVSWCLRVEKQTTAYEQFSSRGAV
jgi:hypothetical protein